MLFSHNDHYRPEKEIHTDASTEGLGLGIDLFGLGVDRAKYALRAVLNVS